MIKLYVVIGGNIGPYSNELVESWRASGVGGACARCGSVLKDGWCGPECPVCEREYQVAKGCLCLGENLCADCRAAGATSATRAPKCDDDCSTMCRVCCPDD